MCASTFGCATHATGCHAETTTNPLPTRVPAPLPDSPALGVFDFMAFVCRWRQFDACNLSCPRFPSIFSIGRATQQNSLEKNEVSDMLQVWRGVASRERQRRRDSVYCLYVLCLMRLVNCAQMRTEAPQPSPQPRLKWQHPLDVATLWETTTQLDLRIPYLDKRKQRIPHLSL